MHVSLVSCTAEGKEREREGLDGRVRGGRRGK